MLTLLGVAAGVAVAAAATPAALRVVRAGAAWLHDDLLALRTVSVEGASRISATDVAAASGLGGCWPQSEFSLGLAYARTVVQYEIDFNLSGPGEEIRRSIGKCCFEIDWSPKAS